MRPPGPLTGDVRVIDGDTIAVGETRIRLEGIDAPETAQTCQRKWFGCVGVRDRGDGGARRA